MINKSTGLTLSIVNPRTVRLHEADWLIPGKNKEEIVYLYNSEGEIILESGQSVWIKNRKYKINSISPTSDISSYDLHYASLTMSSIFATPLLATTRESIMWDSHFVNAFVETEDNSECIALLYKYSGDTTFSKFERSIEQSKHYVSTIDVDSYHSLYVFNVPSIALDTYNKFKTGRYSKIEEVWKNKILSFHGFTKKGKTGQILYKSKKLRKKLEKLLDVNLYDCELHSVPNMNKEKFNPKYYSTK